MSLKKEIFEKALKLKEQGKKIKEIMTELNITENVCTYSNFRNRLYRLEREEKNKIIFEDKKPVPTSDDINEYYNQLKEIEKAKENLDTKQTCATITLEEDKPVLIAFSGDWHIGAQGLDYEQFDKDRKLIKETDGAYFIGMGDYIDNASPHHHKNTGENTINQDMQRKLAMMFMTELSDKCLALIRGCHECVSYKLDQRDLIEEFAEAAKAINLWHGGKLNIKIGDQNYKIFARHKYKNESSMNTTNAQRSMLNDAGPCDICALAHKHFPDLQMLDRMGDKVIYLRSGSYKKYDEFGQRIGGYSAIKAIPSVIIYPNEHKLVPFQELEDAVTFLKAIRN